jgi:hypothetical protein
MLGYRDCPPHPDELTNDRRRWLMEQPITVKAIEELLWAASPRVRELGTALARMFARL